VPQTTTGMRRLLISIVVAFLAMGPLTLGPLAADALAAGDVTMSARILLQGHARVGSWVAIEVQLANDGPSVEGELRMDGGSQSQTRFSMRVDLPTGSRLTYVLHAQPPPFGRTLKVDLVSSGSSIKNVTVAYLVHDAGQLVVGVLAEPPQGIVAELSLPPGLNGASPATVPLTIADLPDRVEGWAPLDRLVWQDVDTTKLSPGQLAAMRGWIAAGGRLVIAGGTAGINTLSGFPDDLLPYRPTATLDVDPVDLTGLFGTLPEGAAELPAMAGALAHGRVLARSGDRAIAAQMPFGSGSVTLLGFDPTTRWLAASKAVGGMWQGLLPPRSAGDGSALSDDSQLQNAVNQLPALQLPPVGGLLLLLAAYILVIGPLNYLILKRLDRREWAWVTMPLLVLAFAAGAYGYGSLLRGTDVLINEVAIVRGAPDTTVGSTQDYFGVFSPTRGTYLVQVPGGALLASPISGSPFGVQAGTLDVVQGDPSEVRGLAVGVAQLRTIRAESATTVPLMRATLKLGIGEITGTFENASDEPLEQVAIVLGSSVVVLGDVAPHSSVPVRLVPRSNAFGTALADLVVGTPFGSSDEEGIRRQVRYAMIGQLTYDPNVGGASQLQAERPVILAFGRRSPLDIRIGGQGARRTTNVLYYVPVDVAIHGKVTFDADLVRSTVVSSDAMQFGKGGPAFFNMGVGKVTVAYRPIPFQGTLVVSQLKLGFTMNGGNFGVGVGGGGVGVGKPIAPLPEVPPTCPEGLSSPPPDCAAFGDNPLPDLEIFDRTGAGAWVRLPQLAAEATYPVEHPERYLDPASGQVLVRFVNDNSNNAFNFGFNVSIVGEVR
jgi:hypothetical protein